MKKLSTNGQKVLLACLAPYMQDVELDKQLSKLGMEQKDLVLYRKQVQTSRFTNRMRML